MRIRKPLIFTLIILILTLLVGSNFLSGYINAFVATIEVFPFATQNNAFTFDEIPSKGRDLKTMEHQFQSFLKENPGTVDTILYRTFKPNLLKFWNWRTYVTHERYRYEYKKN